MPTSRTPGGSAPPVPGITSGLADRRGGHAGDLDAGHRDHPGPRWLGMLCPRRDGEETLASMATATHW
jgi:hypothetical protein